MAISYKSTLHDRERIFTASFGRCEEAAPEGVLYHGEHRTGLCFTGYWELEQMIEDCFQQQQYPRVVMEPRVFQGKENRSLWGNERKAGERQENDRIYRIRVTQRQNASWQGLLLQEGQEAYEFSSFLKPLVRLDGSLNNRPVQWLDGAAGKEQRKQQVEHYLRFVVYYPENVTALADTLIYRFYEKGESRTFVIHPMFYEHDTCQGRVYWKECRRQNSFRSFLELAGMMNAAAEGSGWEDKERVI